MMMLGLKGLKGQLFKGKYEPELEFPEGRGWGGSNQKTLRGGGYGYFLEQHDGSTTSLRKSEQRINLLLSLQLRHYSNR